MDSLFELVLVDGIKATVDGREIRYRKVHLRETNVADERAALRMAERVVHVGGQPRLLVSDADFRYAMTMRHIDAIECDGTRLAGAALDLELLGKLSTHDLGLIERRVFLITMAAQVRYGLITQEQCDALIGGTSQAPAAPQPTGPAAAPGAPAAPAQPGPELLADYAGDAAHSAASGAGG